MYVCLCAVVTEDDVRNAVAAGARDVEDIGRLTEAGTVCGTCLPRIRRLLDHLESIGSEHAR